MEAPIQSGINLRLKYSEQLLRLILNNKDNASFSFQVSPIPILPGVGDEVILPNTDEGVLLVVVNRRFVFRLDVAPTVELSLDLAKRPEPRAIG